MLQFLFRRFIYMIVTLLAISIVGFIIIQLPPGDYLTSYIAELKASGQEVSQSEVESLRRRYGLNQPAYLRYFTWMKNMLRGDFGVSFRWNRPVNELIGERLALTATVSLVTISFAYIVAIVLGIYAAVYQYGVGDYFLTAWAFIGLATPNFLLALVLMFLFYKFFGWSVVGLFSPDYVNASWSLAKFVDLLKHLPVPVLVIGTASVAGLFRIMRSSLLDELQKQYVTTARAKGLSEMKLLFKYPIRVALNPVVSTLTWTFPQIVSGGALVAIVLGLPTMGPLLLQALKTQDMYLAGTLMIFISFFTVMGTLISDLLLLWMDPRIKME